MFNQGGTASGSGGAFGINQFQQIQQPIAPKIELPKPPEPPKAETTEEKPLPSDKTSLFSDEKGDITPKQKLEKLLQDLQSQRPEGLENAVENFQNLNASEKQQILQYTKLVREFLQQYNNLTSEENPQNTLKDTDLPTWANKDKDIESLVKFILSEAGTNPKMQELLKDIQQEDEKKEKKEEIDEEKEEASGNSSTQKSPKKSKSTENIFIKLSKNPEAVSLIANSLLKNKPQDIASGVILAAINLGTQGKEASQINEKDITKSINTFVGSTDARIDKSLQEIGYNGEVKKLENSNNNTQSYQVGNDEKGIDVEIYDDHQPKAVTKDKAGQKLAEISLPAPKTTTVTFPNSYAYCNYLSTNWNNIYYPNNFQNPYITNMVNYQDAISKAFTDRLKIQQDLLEANNKLLQPGNKEDKDPKKAEETKKTEETKKADETADSKKTNDIREKFQNIKDKNVQSLDKLTEEELITLKDAYKYVTEEGKRDLPIELRQAHDELLRLTFSNNKDEKQSLQNWCKTKGIKPPEEMGIKVDAQNEKQILWASLASTPSAMENLSKAASEEGQNNTQKASEYLVMALVAANKRYRINPPDEPQIQKSVQDLKALNIPLLQKPLENIEKNTSLIKISETPKQIDSKAQTQPRQAPLAQATTQMLSKLPSNEKPLYILSNKNNSDITGFITHTAENTINFRTPNAPEKAPVITTQLPVTSFKLPCIVPEPAKIATTAIPQEPKPIIPLEIFTAQNFSKILSEKIQPPNPAQMQRKTTEPPNEKEALLKTVIAKLENDVKMPEQAPTRKKDTATDETADLPRKIEKAVERFTPEKGHQTADKTVAPPMEIYQKVSKIPATNQETIITQPPKHAEIIKEIAKLDTNKLFEQLGLVERKSPVSNTTKREFLQPVKSEEVKPAEDIRPKQNQTRRIEPVSNETPIVTDLKTIPSLAQRLTVFTNTAFSGKPLPKQFLEELKKIEDKTHEEKTVIQGKQVEQGFVQAALVQNTQINTSQIEEKKKIAFIETDAAKTLQGGPAEPERAQFGGVLQAQKKDEDKINSVGVSPELLSLLASGIKEAPETSRQNMDKIKQLVDNLGISFTTKATEDALRRSKQLGIDPDNQEDISKYISAITHIANKGHAMPHPDQDKMDKCYIRSGAINEKPVFLMCNMFSNNKTNVIALTLPNVEEYKTAVMPFLQENAV